MQLHVRLFYALLVSNVTLRFFTNYLNVLPRFFNITDVIITFLLWGMSLGYNGPVSDPELYRKISRSTLLFNAILLCGVLLNLEFFYAPSAVSQAVMLNEPFLLILALLRRPIDLGQARGFIRILEFLIKAELFIGILQIPLFIARGESEELMGTFQHNAEQYAAFLTLGMFYVIGKMKTMQGGRLRNWLFIMFTLGLIVAIDNKASWLGLFVSMFVVLVMLGAIRGRLAGIMGGVLASAALLVVGLSVATHFSTSLSKFDRLAEASRSGNLKKLGKIKALLDITESWETSPHMALVGSGVGNFYSRAARQFFPLSERNMYSETAALEVRKGPLRESDSMGGMITQADTPAYFHKFYASGEQIYPLGTGQVDEPFSSYNGLLGETGIIGSFAYLGVYGYLFRRLLALLKEDANDSELLPPLVATFGMLIYFVVNSIYTPFLETGRMMTIFWSLVACVVCLAAKDSQPDDEEWSS